MNLLVLLYSPASPRVLLDNSLHSHPDSSAVRHCPRLDIATKISTRSLNIVTFVNIHHEVDNNPRNGFYASRCDGRCKHRFAYGCCMYISSKVLNTSSLPKVQQDPSQSGYLPNHNIDPTKLSTFTLGWRVTYNVNEKFYAKPLVWTPPGGTSEQVIMVSNQNIIRLIDGATGTLLKSRTLNPPFQSIDTNCGDIPNTVGITVSNFFPLQHTCGRS